MTALPRAVTAVVVSFNTVEDTVECLRSLREHGAPDLPIVVVDNASQDGTTSTVRATFPEVTVVALATNKGFGAANNIGLERVATDYALLINSDARLRDGSLVGLVRYLDEHPATAIVGPKTLNEDGSLQMSWGADLGLWSEWKQRRRTLALEAGDSRALARLGEECRSAGHRDWVSGSCLAARVDVMRSLQGFDEGFFLYEEDVDLCRRAREAGWEVAFEPAAVVTHRRGRSMRQAPAAAILEYHRSHLRYYRKHLGPGAVLALRTWMALRALAGRRASRSAGDLQRSEAWGAVLALTLRPGRHH